MRKRALWDAGDFEGGNMWRAWLATMSDIVRQVLHLELVAGVQHPLLGEHVRVAVRGDEARDAALERQHVVERAGQLAAPAVAAVRDNGQVARVGRLVEAPHHAEPEAGDLQVAGDADEADRFVVLQLRDGVVARPCCSHSAVAAATASRSTARRPCT